MSTTPPEQHPEGGDGAGERRAVHAVRQRIEELGRSEKDGTAEEYAVLRARLDEVPGRRRGRVWRRTSILTDLTFRQRPRHVRKQLAAMRQRHQERGNPAAFDRFWAECAQVLAPYSLSPHGYVRALTTRDEGAVWREVAAMQRDLERRGYPCFVNSGTLLGLIREGGLIGHDVDVDLAVVLPAEEAEAAAAAWIDLGEVMRAGGQLDPQFESRDGGHVKLRSTTGVGIDLFPAWARGDRIRVWPHTPDGNRQDLLPLAERDVAGTSVRLPRYPEPMLVNNYGPDWRTPDPTWKFHWRTARERPEFAPFLAEVARLHRWAGQR